MRTVSVRLSVNHVDHFSVFVLFCFSFSFFRARETL